MVEDSEVLGIPSATHEIGASVMRRNAKVGEVLTDVTRICPIGVAPCEWAKNTPLDATQKRQHRSPYDATRPNLFDHMGGLRKGMMGKTFLVAIDRCQ